MSERVTVDWTACRGRGTCSELLPERITLDEWGYPLVDPAPVADAVRPFAREAVAACPTAALRLVAATPAGSSPAAGAAGAPEPAGRRRDR